MFSSYQKCQKDLELDSAVLILHSWKMRIRSNKLFALHPYKPEFFFSAIKVAAYKSFTIYTKSCHCTQWHREYQTKCQKYCCYCRPHCILILSLTENMKSCQTWWLTFSNQIQVSAQSIYISFTFTFCVILV